MSISRAAVIMTLVAIVLATGGCSTLTVAPGLTAPEAESKTTALVDQVQGGIDESLIARLDSLSSEPYVCYPPQADSDGSIVAWHSRGRIVLTDEAVPIDVLDDILAGFDESEWSIGQIEEFMGETGSGDVRLSTATGPQDSSYSINITARATGATPAAITVIAMSPCFETK